MYSTISRIPKTWYTSTTCNGLSGVCALWALSCTRSSLRRLRSASFAFFARISSLRFCMIIVWSRRRRGVRLQTFVECSQEQNASQFGLVHSGVEISSSSASVEIAKPSSVYSSFNILYLIHHPSKISVHVQFIDCMVEMKFHYPYSLIYQSSNGFI